MVHIIKDLVFTDHAPDKGISFGSDAGMNRPARGDHRLLVMHHNVTRFLRLPHHVENAGVIIHIEIEINFHPALVSVTRHGVPQVTWSQLRQPHTQLAGFQHIRDKIFVNCATVTGEVIA
ncbi:hypothetical protein BvCmsKSP081_00152 [Escherichia coli]|nr:hypothetical protein BvCmsKSP081_00152 [Escherichia coli]